VLKGQKVLLEHRDQLDPQALKVEQEKMETLALQEKQAQRAL
jgi:hypothetical protein